MKADVRTGAGVVQAGLLVVRPAGSSGATATRGTNWRPTLVARLIAGRATANVAETMMHANSTDLKILARENDLSDKISSSSSICPRLSLKSVSDYSRKASN